MPQNVRKGEELNEQNLKAFLQKNDLINDVNSELEVSQFSTGFSNLTYRLQIENQDLVLRRPPAGAIKRGHDMGREFKVLSGLNKAFSKVPKAYAYTEDADIIGASFYIMEKVDGIILDTKEAHKRQILPTTFSTIANSWMDTFVELHQVDYQAIGLGDLGKPEGYVERQVRNWGKQYLKAATEEIPAALGVMKWLNTHQPTTYDHALIHNDYKYDNVVFKDDTWQEVRAVLDWEMSTLGDPLMDLGTSLAYWSMRSDSDFITKGFPSPTAMDGNPGRNELVEMYAKKSGRSIDNLVFYYAFGLFKIAVIVQQIYYRYDKGLTTDPRFKELNKATQLFTTMAWQAIQKGRIEKLF
ncbi:MAG: aminoglycoside phosphotransferase (APT) family kinase protein [Paraglaciecola sp.]|jgi:aminoglycoside phosphotransferase (APT) family kinase protein